MHCSCRDGCALCASDVGRYEEVWDVVLRERGQSGELLMPRRSRPACVRCGREVWVSVGRRDVLRSPAFVHAL